jgi:hypothetical protein
MNKFIILMLIIVIQFNYVLSSNNNLDDKILEITCLEKYTGIFHNFIYIANNETSDDYYVIRTPWLIIYPNKLKNQLKEFNLTIFDSNPSTKCGWTKLAHVKNYAVSTGTIYRKKNNIDELNSILTKILSNNFPTLELLITGFGLLLVLLLFIYIYVKYKSRSKNFNYRNSLV